MNASATDRPATYQELLIRQSTERELYALANAQSAAEYMHEICWADYQRALAESQRRLAPIRARWLVASERLKAATAEDRDVAAQHLAEAQRIEAEAAAAAESTT